MKTMEEFYKEFIGSKELQEKVKNTSDGELTDDDVQAATGGRFPIFTGLEEKDSVCKPI